MLKCQLAGCRHETVTCVQTPEFRIRSVILRTMTPYTILWRWLDFVVEEGWERTWASSLRSWPRKGSLSMRANPSFPAPQMMVCTSRPPGKAQGHPPIILMDLVVNVAAFPHSTRPSPFCLPELQSSHRQQLPWVTSGSKHYERAHLSIHCGVEAVISNPNTTPPC